MESSASCLYFRVSSPSQRRSGDIRHTGASDHLSVFSVPAETRGRSFQTGPFTVSLVLCLIARLAPQIKQPFLWIGDLILYVTFLNLARAGFSHAGSVVFLYMGASELSQRLSHQRAASRPPHQSQPTAKTACYETCGHVVRRQSTDVLQRSNIPAPDV